jgi:glycosyltransferase involved in cell wall biosynthesis
MKRNPSGSIMNKPIKHIAFVSPRFAEGTTVGGAETLLKNLALRLAARGIRITFLATCAKDHLTWANALPPGRKQVGPIELIRFPVDRKEDPGGFSDIQTEIVLDIEVSPAEERKWIANSVNSQALYDHLRSHGEAYDCIITGPYLFGITWYAAQIHPHKTLLLPCLHDESFARLKIMKLLFDAVAGIIYNAEPEADLAAHLYETPREKGRVVGMGLEPFEADGEAFKTAYGIDRPYVLYCGRREIGKGTPLMTSYLSTFRQRTGRDLMLLCTGSGHIDAPAEMQSHIRDLGFVSETDKHNAMAGALAFIHPSTFESFGIVLLESFLAGTPGLVHANGDVLRWQCQQSNGGFWFRHYPDFEQELLLLMDDPDLRRRLGQNGRRYVLEYYAWETVEDRLMRALEDLL